MELPTIIVVASPVREHTDRAEAKCRMAEIDGGGVVVVIGLLLGRDAFPAGHLSVDSNAIEVGGA